MNAPRSKKEWQAVVKKYGLAFYSTGKDGWLDHLPISNGKIKPVPLVIVKLSERQEYKEWLALERLALVDSTIMFVPGYHHPVNCTVFALTRPSDEWWNERELTKGGYYLRKA